MGSLPVDTHASSVSLSRSCRKRSSVPKMRSYQLVVRSENVSLTWLRVGQRRRLRRCRHPNFGDLAGRAGSVEGFPMCQLRKDPLYSKAGVMVATLLMGATGCGFVDCSGDGAVIGGEAVPVLVSIPYVQSVEHKLIALTSP